MPITNLAIRYSYAENVSDLPIVLLVHGWSGNADDFGNATLQRIAARKLFVASVGMRGRNGASGQADASGREIHDIYDALTWIRATFPQVSREYASVVGYSGGGGNALAAACKFPDAWCQVVSHFGMSDYGYNNPDGWYYNGGNYAAEIANVMGGTPAQIPNNYRARNAVEAITNYSGGHLYLFHDSGDGSVPVVHSQRIASAMSSAGMSNYAANLSGPADSIRWLHGYPTSSPLWRSEDTWARDAAGKVHPAWTIPTSGTVRVIGYIVTKRFSIWLGNGQSHVASVVYNTSSRQYTVTPLTGTVVVTITQGGQSATQTISSETAINL